MQSPTLVDRILTRAVAFSSDGNTAALLLVPGYSGKELYLPAIVTLIVPRIVINLRIRPSPPPMLSPLACLGVAPDRHALYQGMTLQLGEKLILRRLCIRA
jgi:hypothetical protein